MTEYTKYVQWRNDNTLLKLSFCYPLQNNFQYFIFQISKTSEAGRLSESDVVKSCSVPGPSVVRSLCLPFSRPGKVQVHRVPGVKYFTTRKRPLNKLSL